MNQEQFDQLMEEVMRLNQQGGAFYQQHQLTPARERWQQALDLLQPVLQQFGNQLPPDLWQFVATLMNNIGSVYDSQGNLVEALKYYEQAFEILNAISPTSTQTASALNNIGFVYRSQGNLVEALKYYEQAFEILNAISPTSTQTASALNNIGGVYDSQGNLVEALKYFEQALAIDRAISPTSTQTASALNNIGFVYRSQGNLVEALKYYEQAFEILNAISPTSTQTASALNNIGGVYDSQGNLVEALKYFEQALAIDRAISPTSTQTASALNNIGFVYRSQGNLVEVLRYFEQALAIDRAISPTSSETAKDLNNIGFVYRSQGNLVEALKYYEQALAIDRAISPTSSETARDLNNIGFVYQSQGNLVEALKYYEKARDTVESLRRMAGGSGAAEAIQGEYSNSYLGAMAILCQQGGAENAVEAFGISETYRARGLTERLGANAAAPRTENEADQALLQRQTELKFAYSRVLDESAQIRAALTSRRWSEERRLTLTQSLDDRNDLRRKIEREQDANDRAIRERFPEFAALSNPDPLDLVSVQQELLDPGTFLLAYLFAGSDLLRWMIRKDQIHFDRRAITEGFRADLVAAVGPLHVGQEGDTDATGRLAALLLGDIPTTLWEGATRGIVLPDAVLFNLPFELLPWDTGVFGDRYPLTYAPSATFLKTLRQLWDTRPAPPTDDKPFIGFGDPDSDGPLSERRAGAGALPGANRETENIARLMNGIARIGPAATERAVFAEVAGKRFVHFATHGFFNADEPLLSGLHLAAPAPTDTNHDGVLTVAEMFSLPLNAHLVACSACVSGRGKTDTGRGIEGMSTALLLAGARTVLVTLWPVHDLSMQMFMETFYEKWQENPDRSVADVLRETRRFIKGIWGTPFHWAPVVAFGLQ